MLFTKVMKWYGGGGLVVGKGGGGGGGGGGGSEVLSRYNLPNLTIRLSLIKKNKIWKLQGENSV